VLLLLAVLSGTAHVRDLRGCGRHPDGPPERASRDRPAGRGITPPARVGAARAGL